MGDRFGITGLIEITLGQGSGTSGHSITINNQFTDFISWFLRLLVQCISILRVTNNDFVKILLKDENNLIM